MVTQRVGAVSRSSPVEHCGIFSIVRNPSYLGSEEELLRSNFGAEYDAYPARTWRLIPGVY
jgi:protein-S-isoprenylcysteine O-methyltransferase Ste14